MRISVYITSYNQKLYLVEAIESVLNQTLKPFEIIIVDDHSTDGSQNIIADYASRYPKLIRPIYHTQNLGISYTRNDALQIVKGDYVTFLDGDDRYLPNKLENEIELLEKNPCFKFVYSNFYCMDANGRHVWIWADKESLPGGDIFKQTLIQEFPKKILFRNELINYESLKRIGFYDLKLKIYEDYDLRLRLTKRFHAVCNLVPGVEYRRHGGGLSSLELDQHLEALRYIHKKNIYLLEDLNYREKVKIQKKLQQNIGEMIKIAAMEKLEKEKGSLSSRILAVRYFFRSIRYCIGRQDIKLISKLILPYKLFKLFLFSYSNIRKLV